MSVTFPTPTQDWTGLLSALGPGTKTREVAERSGQVGVVPNKRGPENMGELGLDARAPRLQFPDKQGHWSSRNFT